MVIYVLFTINAYCGSNYYVIINDTTFSDFETFDYRINSLGGHESALPYMVLKIYLKNHRETLPRKLYRPI